VIRDQIEPLETPVMRSPFPGMDPYLEQFWGDIHHTMITFARAAIQKDLPRDLVARVGERVYVERWEGDGRNIFPDVRVVEHGRPREPMPTAGTGITLAEPLIIHLDESEPVHQGYIEIIDLKSGRKVVTVIEVLSPSNKVPGPVKDLYLQKQHELHDGGVSLVEIDLLRRGTRVLSVPSERLPEGRKTPYAACTRRGWKAFEVEYYPISLRERLPAIAVPLRQDDRDVALDLQALVDPCYEAGHYGEDIDYREEADPPLAPEDAKWADALLREKGRRG
jgi:hypothetical protein